ncbi:NAD-dependent epimerase/dehydratase family protein [Streptomyces sp. NPDC093089]|uniref:NAD-dependent epimerase/dehydratase family protein n=1 Tax=Streptomyces sp. NPDC093089 TaxID=3366024 RepID=UPI00382DBE12
MPRILITGSTGFIGGRVAATAAALPDVGHLRLLARRPLPPAAPAPATGAALRPAGGSAGQERNQDGRPDFETVVGDLRDPASLHRACAGVDVLIHCASAIGADEETARSVNDEGTRALVDAAVRAGVTRIVALSTASVHGRGPFRAAAPGTLPLAPGSTTSRTRAAGERHVLAAGGAVLRPHLVYGVGDRQLVPGLVRLLAELPGPLDAGASLHSVTGVDGLARALLGAALSERAPAGAYYVAHPEPVPVAELLAPCEALLAGRAGPPRGPAVGIAEARALLADVPFALHHLAMLATDHWFDDDRPRREWAHDPGPNYTTGIAAPMNWYREFLSEA